MLTHRLTSPWNFKQGFLILLSFVVLYLALSAGHMIWVKYTVGVEQYLTKQTDFFVKVMITSQAIKALAIILVIGLIATKYYRVSWHALGFKATSWRWVCIAIVAAILAFIVRLYLMKWLATEVPAWVKFMQPPLQDLSLSNASLATYLLLTIIITPVVEEIFFRGFLFQWMSSNRPVWLAAIVSSIMFGVSHIVPPQAIAAAVLSLVIIVLFVCSGSIWPAIVAHVVNNTLSVGYNLMLHLND
ncbi:CPBP family intramembrane glutamic endopeptidase [Thalassotalea marina]|uniref:CAAX prenyl protease 2/Lysostaphin resistance protein A-like domain-containing protein n=1 Tax=Thalassotalea marina TaxID=1673741 RepID=A0A919BCZ0_9GAMM|nr:CPBP family intramembrane glutamic endopeptidase [Thalassotalea marina]GHF79840.1 hypothetical protein GCM10017161_03800 [Thalassotalea marina]